MEMQRPAAILGLVGVLGITACSGEDQQGTYGAPAVETPAPGAGDPGAAPGTTGPGIGTDTTSAVVPGAPGAVGVTGSVPQDTLQRGTGTGRRP